MIDGMVRAPRAPLPLALGAGRGHRRAPRPAAADAAGPSDFRSEVTGIVPAVDGVHGRDPRRRLVPRAHGGRGPHGHRRGLHRASRTCASSPTAPSSGTACRRRPTSTTTARGRSTIPADGHRGRARRRTGVGARSPTAAPTPGTTTACTGWTTSSPSVDRGEQVPGAYDPWRVPIVVDGARRGGAGDPRLRGVGVAAPLPRPRGHRRRACSAFYGRGPGLRLAAGLLAVVVPRRRSWSAGPTTRPPPTAAGTRCTGRWPASRSSTGVGAVVLAHRRVGVVLALASVASLSGWALFRIEVLFKPVLPTDLPYAARPHGRRARARRERRRRRDRRPGQRPAASPSSPTTIRRRRRAHNQPIFLKRRHRKKQMTAMTTSTV